MLQTHQSVTSQSNLELLSLSINAKVIHHTFVYLHLRITDLCMYKIPMCKHIIDDQVQAIQKINSRAHTAQSVQMLDKKKCLAPGC
jgi:hypothetical protein